MKKSKTSIWAIIPAAGIGTRMGSIKPKQYLNLAGKFIIDITLQKILSLPDIEKVIVAIAKEDKFWQKSNFFNDTRIETVLGGPERYLSVLNALERLKKYAKPNDWVLVHDAVRPCINKSDVENLILKVQESEIGGLLGTPVKDTIKKVSPSNEVLTTIERNDLWQALTPQIFRFSILYEAIFVASKSKLEITDEASALEALGREPIIVEGRSDNIKVTRPEDLKLAEILIGLQDKNKT